MAASSCRRPRLRYSMTRASPCMVRIPDSEFNSLELVQMLPKMPGRDKGGQAPPASADAVIKSGFGCAADLAGEAAVRTAASSGAASAGDCLVHDAADGACATPALGTAAETAIDLAGRARGPLGRERRAHVVVAQHVAGTNDHGGRASQPAFSSLCN